MSIISQFFKEVQQMFFSHREGNSVKFCWIFNIPQVIFPVVSPKFFLLQNFGNFFSDYESNIYLLHKLCNIKYKEEHKHCSSTLNLETILGILSPNFCAHSVCVVECLYMCLHKISLFTKLKLLIQSYIFLSIFPYQTYFENIILVYSNIHYYSLKILFNA